MQSQPTTSRACRVPSCRRHALPAKAFCRTHIHSAPARSYHRQLQSAIDRHKSIHTPLSGRTGVSAEHERIQAKNRDAAGIPTAKQRVAYGQVPCQHSGCENLVRADRVYCPEHRTSPEARAHFQEPPSLSAEERRREDFRLGFVDNQIVHTPGLDPEPDDPEFVWKDKFDTALR